MSKLETVKKVFFSILIFVYFAFALIMTMLLLNYNDYGVTKFGQTSLIILKEKVSSNEYKQGDLVLVEEVELKDIQAGETIFTYRAGKPTKVYNNVGTYLSIIESQWGFLFIVLVPCILLFIYQVYALIIEIKYGADED